MAAAPAMTVLQVLPALETGGVEKGTVEMVEAITRAGGNALVASEGGRMVAAVERAGGRHVTLPLASKNPARILANARPLAELIRREGVAIVHARSRAPAWSAWLAARRTGAHFVTTFHGVYREDFPGKRRYNAVMAQGERVIAISHHVAREIIARHGTDPARIRIIPRGVDPDEFDPDRVGHERLARFAASAKLPEAPIIMLPARLTPWKGHALLIAALARMVRRDAVALLVGSDQGRHRYAASLMAEAKSLGVAA